MQRYDFLNQLISDHGFKDYLEIGVADGECFKRIKARNRTWVDPRPFYHEDGVTAYPVDSDTAFESMPESKVYDLIFIDGAHRWENVIRDFKNSINHLSRNGLIVFHDCNPLTETAQETIPTHGPWNGCVWKAFVALRAEYREYFDMMTIDTDEGLGFAYRYRDFPHLPKTKVHLKFIKPENMSYNFLETNRREALSLLSLSQFWTWHKNLLAKPEEM